jgi:hypothetical protein
VVRAAISLLVILVASTMAWADEGERVLGMALAEAQLGHCTEALAHLDQYLAATKNPSPDAFDVMRRCPRGQTPAPTPAPPAHKEPRRHLFLADLAIGINVPLTSGAPEVAFLGVAELGVEVWPRGGLALVLLFESLVSRPDIGPGGTPVTVYSANLLLGLEERRVVWRKLSVFGTLAAGILVDTNKGFESGASLHVDAGLGWTLGPGDVRLRPLDFAIFVGDGSGASWRATAGYAFRF